MIFRHAQNKNLGKEGERIAVEYLRKKGYRVIEKNYRTRRGEIDIICEQRGSVIFVEVKTRKSMSFGRPEEAVDSRKRKKMAEIALDYLTEKHLNGRVDCRFDVVAITEKSPRIVNHIVDAFRP